MDMMIQLNLARNPLDLSFSRRFSFSYFFFFRSPNGEKEERFLDFLDLGEVFVVLVTEFHVPIVSTLRFGNLGDLRSC